MTAYDGPTLRAVRESMGVPLRRIARTAGMSHGHLSKVERGEYGRPVTPAIMAAYERATGVRLADAVAAVTERGELPAGRHNGKMWRPGEMSTMRRRGYNAAVAALTIGGHLGEPFLRLLDSTGRPLCPASPGPVAVEQLEQFIQTATTQDLRYGGAMISQQAKAMLRWAVPMLDAGDMDASVDRRLHAAIGMLAHRTAWAAFDCAAHDSARSLFRLALYAAVRASDADLRAHVLADVAAQQDDVGYPEDALEIVRFAEGDERVAPAVQMVIQGVKARAFAAIGDAAACRRCVADAERHHDRAGCSSNDAHWVRKLSRPQHLHALIGHALADLVTKTEGQEDVKQAIERLTEAVDVFDPVDHARAHSLCAARLARLLLDTGDLERGDYFAHLALRAVAQLGSTRLTRELAFIRARAASLGEEPAMCRLVDAIDDMLRADPSEGYGGEAAQ
jgi:transcriptional regulator with XRE-family HTH domain